MNSSTPNEAICASSDSDPDTFLRLREKHPGRLLSEIAEAVQLALTFAPGAAPQQTETIASYILEKLMPPGHEL